MKKIGLIGLNKADNLGDPILYKSTKYLLESNEEEFEIIEINMLPKIKLFSARLFSKVFTFIILTLEFLGFKNSKFVYSLQYFRSKKLFFKNFSEDIKYIDGLIFAGGGIIKYKYENLDILVSLIVEVAEKYDVPIFFNAVGVEDYEENNIKCQHLKYYLNKDSVKGVTTRDYIDILEANYIENEEIHTSLVADSAFWVNEVYREHINIERQNRIGLGIARYEIFGDNGIAFTKEQQLQFWLSIVELLESNKEMLYFYTNGSSSDNQFLYEIIEHLEEHGYKVKYFIPKNDVELVQFTASCERILATRLHASIVAYSLQVPSCGLIWNDKITFFSEQIGYRNRYFFPHEANAKVMVKELLEANYSYNDLLIRNELREATKQKIDEFIDTIL